MSTYDIDGNEFASVTTIIGDCIDKSSALTQWAANCVVDWIRQNCTKVTAGVIPYFAVFDSELDSARKNFRDVSQTALDVGSEVHKYIEQYLQGITPEPPSSEQAWNGIDAFIQWTKAHDIETHQTEMKVVGNYWAGTLDWYGRFDGKMTVIDFKTSKAFYMDQYGPQIAAYRSVVGAEASGILRLDKTTGLPEYKDFSKRYKKDLAVFQAMVNLYYLKHPKLAKKAGVPF
jgi:hypothetical protein